LNEPKGLAFDANGNLYIADSPQSRPPRRPERRHPTFAGNGSASFGGGPAANDGGPATNGLLHSVRHRRR
jgi:hypothetical protein